MKTNIGSLFLGFLFLYAVPNFAQVSIVSEDFEGGGSWAYTPNPAAFTVGSDVWDVVSNSIGSINAQGPGTDFWGVQDLANGNGGTSTGVAGTLTFANQNVSTFNSLIITFDYQVVGFDTGDGITYELVLNGVGQGSTALFTGGVGGLSTAGWVTQTINVPGTPTTVGLIISVTQNGGSDYAGFDNFELEGTLAGPCLTPPTIQASGLNISNVTNTTADLSWTNGNGLGRIVVIREGAAVTATPANMTTYTASAAFGAGSDLGGGQYVVYAGAGNSVTVTGLTPGESYHFAVYEYNCAAGSEQYQTTSPSTGSATTEPENIQGFDYTCITNNSVTMSWSLPTSTYDGVVIFVEQGSTPADPTLDASSYINANANFLFAPNYGSGRRLIYKGTGTSLTVTNLTNALDYTFKAFVYKNNTGTIWSTGAQRTVTIGLNNVKDLNGIPGDGNATIRWTNPDVSCFDEILIVADVTSGINFNPTGNGSAYTANNVYAGPNQVVYKGTGTSVNVSSLQNGTTYCFEVFIREGTNWSTGEEVCLTPGITLFPGDLIIIGFDNNISGGTDRLVVTNMVDFPTGTSFSISNACYELNAASNVRTERWYSASGNVDSTIHSQRFTYLGASTVSAGSVWCLDLPASIGAPISTVSLNGVALTSGVDFVAVEDASPNGVVNFSTSNPDAIFLMQGAWTLEPTYGTFDGRVLGGIMDGAAWYDVSDNTSSLPTFQSRRRSRIPPDIECFAIEGNSTPGNYYAYYNGTRNASFHNLISGIVNFASNWIANTGTGGNDLPGTVCSNTFTITGTVMPGLWTGEFDNNWFDCHNWDNFQVPDSGVNVVVNAAPNEAKVDYTAIYSDRYSDTASCKNLTINGTQKVDISGNSLNILAIYGTLTLTGTGVLDADDSNDNNLDGQVVLHGDWSNLVSTAAFVEGNSLVRFVGNNDQKIEAGGLVPEGFFSVDVSKVSGNLVLNHDVIIDDAYGPATGQNGRLLLQGGKINANNFMLAINNDQLGGIQGYANNRYVYGGVLRRAVANNTAGYDFPVGTSNYYELASLDVVGTAGATDIDVEFHTPLASLVLTPNLTDPTDAVNFSALLNAGYWTIADNPVGTYTGTYNLTLSETGFTNGGAGHYTIVKRPNNAGAWSIPAIDGGFLDFGLEVLAIRFGYTTFSDFAIALDQPLDLDWKGPWATAVDGKVDLAWELADVAAISLFEIERSQDGDNFELIQAGSTNQFEQGNVFTTKDFQPAFGTNYYRIRAIMADGQSLYSSTVAVELGQADELTLISLFPNPITESLNLRLYSPQASELIIEMYSLEGRVVWQEKLHSKVGDQTLSWDMSSLPAGSYLYTIRTGLTIKTGKIFKK
jgi:hypothetical protein